MKEVNRNMWNMVYVLGHLVKIEGSNDNLNDMIISVPRDLKVEKNEDIKEDLIICKASKHIMECIIEYCNVGSTLGIKGRIQREENTDRMYVLVDKVSFLSAKKEEDKNEDSDTDRTEDEEK